MSHLRVDEDGLVVGEREIFGQRLDENGLESGANDSRISFVGGTGDPAFGAYFPDVTWNVTDNEYLVVWIGDTGVGEPGKPNTEIYGMLLGSLIIFNDGFETGATSAWSSATR